MDVPRPVRPSRAARQRRDREPPARAAHLPAGPGVHRAGQREGGAVPRGRGGLRGVLGEAGPRADQLVQAVPHDAAVGPAVRPLVRRRRAQHHLQLRRPPRRERAGGQGRVSLDRRAGRRPRDHLRGPPSRGPEGRQRSAPAGHRQGRPGRDLHAHDPRAAHRDARLRPHRRPAHRGVRRLLSRGPCRPDQRRRGKARHHRGWRLAARQAGRAQAGRGRGRPVDADRHGRARRPAPR